MPNKEKVPELTADQLRTVTGGAPVDIERLCKFIANDQAGFMAGGGADKAQLQKCYNLAVQKKFFELGAELSSIAQNSFVIGALKVN